MELTEIYAHISKAMRALYEVRKELEAVSAVDASTFLDNALDSLDETEVSIEMYKDTEGI